MQRSGGIMSADKVKKAEKSKADKAQKQKKKPEKVAKKREPLKPSRLIETYKKEVLPALIKQFDLKNVNEAPKLEKIVLNVGAGKATQDAKLLDEAVETLRNISGQQPVVTKAKKAISNFKLRQGQPIGCKVTMRQNRMYAFFDRLVNVVLPRVRDFRGISPKSFDGHGNYALGIKEQITFPEINRDKIDRIMGLDIIICTTADTDEKALALLKKMGMPFRK